MERRTALLTAAALAFEFGIGISQSVAAKKKARFAVLFGTRYGATRDTSLWINRGLGQNSSVYDVSAIQSLEALEGVDYLIFGSGIWTGVVHQDLVRLLDMSNQSLKSRVIATFVVCGTRPNTPRQRKRIAAYLSQINDRVGIEPEFSESFGGRLNVDQLSENDRRSLTDFYQRQRKGPLVSWDHTDEGSAGKFGEILLNSKPANG